MHGKKAKIKSSAEIESKMLAPPLIGFFNLGKEVYNMVCLAKIVLYVVVVCLITELAELVLESAALLEKTMDFAAYYHRKIDYPQASP